MRNNPGRFKVVGLSAGGSDVALLAQQAIEFHVPVVAVADANRQSDLQQAITAQATPDWNLDSIHIISGESAATEIAAQPCDVVLNGITGSAGLQPTVATLKAGTTLALANKESLVIGGRAVTSLARTGQIVPVDSEHSALAQCLRGGSADEVRKLILTASGGPFRNSTPEELATVNAEEALNHPTWSMGPVVTVNSSTMFNKGLEIIEAHLLFDIPFERIDVVVHPQSIVHSMVEFVDGSILTQASPPDMHLPIALGLAWPDRVPSATNPVDFGTASSWTFEPVRHEIFPAVNLAKSVGERAGTAPAAMNSANEVAVAAFLAGEISYLGIIKLVEQVIAEHLSTGFVSDEQLTIEKVITASAQAREVALDLMRQRSF